MKVKKSIKFKIFITFIVLIIIILALSLHLGNIIASTGLNLISRQDTIKNLKIYSMPDYKKLKEEYIIKNLSINSSKFDHTIPAFYIDTKNDKGIVVMIHGLGGTKESLASPARIFTNLGYDVIAYDQRNSGDNKAKLNTFGYLESYDCLDVINKAKELNKNKLIVWGESMGGLTAAVTAGRDDTNIDCLILDCPLLDAKIPFMDEMYSLEKEYGLPAGYSFFFGNLVSKLRYGVDLNKTNASDWLEKSNKPILIFNSKVDKVTPYYMGKSIFDSIGHDKKELVSSEKSEHTMIYEYESDLYINSLNNFLDKYLK